MNLNDVAMCSLKKRVDEEDDVGSRDGVKRKSLEKRRPYGLVPLHTYTLDSTERNELIL